VPANPAILADAVSHDAPIRALQAERFTLDGDDHLERDIARLCAVALRGVERNIPLRRLEALWLGGGYGRGEGGVLRLPSGDQPYNDLEFYVCLRGNQRLNRRRFGPPLQKLAEGIGRTAGLDVEFQIVSLAQLQHSQPSMFYYDLVAGHRQLFGAERVLDRCIRHTDPSCLPISEATRLLMNRGTGLVLARQRLSRKPLSADDADFIGRNIAKAQLAMGDAVLTALGRYHWSCLERHRQLLALPAAEAPPWARELRQHHAAGVAFKLHPKLSPPRPELLCREYERVAGFMLPVWLWVESRRLGTEFPSEREYVASTLDKWPETNRWRNRLLNAWIHGPAAFFWRRSQRHPRERVLNALTLLLWDNEDLETRLPAVLHDGLPDDPAIAAQASNLLLNRVPAGRALAMERLAGWKPNATSFLRGLF
jgi:hypothetical protein